MTRKPRSSVPSVIDAAKLRDLLIERARGEGRISYGAVAEQFQLLWHQGTGASLKKALNEVDAENRKRNEPRLMALVVNKETTIPGDGFFVSIGCGTADAEQRRAIAEIEIERCKAFAWPDT